MPPVTVREHVRACLDEVSFPATRNDLLDAATRQGDPTAALALREIPRRDYTDVDDVLEVIEAS